MITWKDKRRNHKNLLKIDIELLFFGINEVINKFGVQRGEFGELVLETYMSLQEKITTEMRRYVRGEIIRN